MKQARMMPCEPRLFGFLRKYISSEASTPRLRINLVHDSRMFSQGKEEQHVSRVRECKSTTGDFGQ